MDEEPRTRPRRRLPMNRSPWRRALAAVMLVGILNACGGSGAGPAQGGTPGARASATIAAASNAVATGAAATELPSRGPVTWRLAWSDEFNAPAGAPPDPAIWGREVGDGTASGIPGWGNNERETYTDDAANAATDGEGHLLISVLAADRSQLCYYGPCEYTSARLRTTTRYEVHYGRLEARIKVPAGVGLWPAFWMLGANKDQVGWPKCGEIDVMEFVGRRPNEILSTIHGPGYSGSSGLSKTVDLGKPVSDEFHTFAIEWRPDHITWSLDGTAYFEASPAEVAPNAWVFNHPFVLTINVAAGGNLGGPIAPGTTFPQSMAVDYVRLYQAPAP